MPIIWILKCRAGRYFLRVFVRRRHDCSRRKTATTPQRGTRCVSIRPRLLPLRGTRGSMRSLASRERATTAFKARACLGTSTFFEFIAWLLASAARSQILHSSLLFCGLRFLFSLTPFIPTFGAAFLGLLTALYILFEMVHIITDTHAFRCGKRLAPPLIFSRSFVQLSGILATLYERLNSSLFLPLSCFQCG